MDKKLIVVLAGLTLVLMLASFAHAQGMFVATAKNFRGAMYQGCGPTPGHAAESAVVRCSQDSFLPCSCKVVCVRMECPPPVCAPPMPRKTSYRKVSGMHPPGPPMYSRPMY